MTLLADSDRRRREVGSPARVEDALLALAGFTWAEAFGCYVDKEGVSYDRWTALDEACAHAEEAALPARDQPCRALTLLAVVVDAQARRPRGRRSSLEATRHRCP